jgi:hypothetical protein
MCSQLAVAALVALASHLEIWMHQAVVAVLEAFLLE